MGKYGGQAYEDGVGFHNEKYFVKSFYKDNKLETKTIKLLDDNFFDKNCGKLNKEICNMIYININIEDEEKMSMEDIEKIKGINKYMLTFSVLCTFFSIFVLIPSFISFLYSLFFNNYIISYIGTIFIIIATIIFIGFKGKDHYKFHAAEHMVGNAYDNNEILNVENVSKYSPIHNRCGSNIIFLINIINLMLFFTILFTNSVFILYIIYMLMFVSPIISMYLLNSKCLSFLMFMPNLFQNFVVKKPDEKHISAAITAFLTLKSLEEQVEESLEESLDK